MVYLLVVIYLSYSEWFEPRSISSSYCVIVRVSVVLKRTVVDD